MEVLDTKCHNLPSKVTYMEVLDTESAIISPQGYQGVLDIIGARVHFRPA